MPVGTLIIDDSDTFRRILAARLERIGCRIVGEARTATDGLNLFRARNPRLILLDLVMPNLEEMNAVQLFYSIRTEAPQTAIVVISSHRKVVNAQRFLTAGAAAYMEKNFMSFDKLAVTLHAVFPELSAP